MNTTSEPSPGLLSFCAVNAWRETRKYYGESTDPAEYYAVKSSVVRDVQRVFKGWLASDLHGAWRHYKRHDKRYLAALKGTPGGNPTLRPWDELDEHDREGFRLFVDTVKKCRDEWDKATQLNRGLPPTFPSLRMPGKSVQGGNMLTNVTIDELGPNDLKGIDALIGKLVESKTAEDQKDLDAARIAYCIDVARTTFNTFLQAIGRGKDYINYEHYVPLILSDDLTITEFNDTVYGTIFGEYTDNNRLNYVRVLFFTVRAAAQSFDRFQVKKSAR